MKIEFDIDQILKLLNVLGLRIEYLRTIETDWAKRETEELRLLTMRLMSQVRQQTP